MERAATTSFGCALGSKFGAFVLRAAQTGNDPADYIHRAALALVNYGLGSIQWMIIVRRGKQ